MLLYSTGSVYMLCTTKFVTRTHQVDPRFRVFHRLFWAFKPCIDAFPFCKQFIQVDGTFLYGKYCGTLLVTTTQDGNRCPVPLAFAIVEGETLDAWSWFLALIRTYVTNKEGICLISDRHKSIIQAVSNEHLGWTPPNAYHVFCLRHIASNVNRRFKDIAIKKLVLKMGYEARQVKLREQLDNLRRVNEDVAQYLDVIPKEKWTLAFDEGRRYGHMTTNLVECINGILKGVRNLPITGVVQSTFFRCVEYFVTRSQQAHDDLQEGHIYTSDFRKTIQRLQQDASAFYVRAYDRQSTRFEVVEGLTRRAHGSGKIFVVILDRHHCDCGMFMAFRYPCAHVIAACSAVNISWEAYIDPVYKLENLINAYNGEWWPLGDYVQAGALIDHLPTLVPDPKMLRAKGRPKSTRIRNEMDWREPGPKQKCGLCKQEGHNRRSCPSRTGASTST